MFFVELLTCIHSSLGKNLSTCRNTDATLKQGGGTGMKALQKQWDILVQQNRQVAGNLRYFQNLGLSCVGIVEYMDHGHAAFLSFLRRRSCITPRPKS